MLRINVLKVDNYIKKITFVGHANYNEYGKDIVCAAASATFLCTVNAIYLVSSDSIEYISNENKQVINVKNNNDIVNKLLINMLNCLKSIEKDYPNNIEIR